MHAGTVLTIDAFNPHSTDRDAFEYLFKYHTVDIEYLGKPEESKKTSYHTLLIGITGTLATMWTRRGLDQYGLEKTLFELGRRAIHEKIREGTLSEHEEIQLGTSNAPEDPPFDAKLIQPSLGNKEEIGMEMDETQTRLIIGTQITDALDNINAIFYDLHKELLFRPREYRISLELVRPAKTREEFVYRIAALGKVVDGINKSVLQKILNESNDEIGSIILLGRYLSERGYDGNKVTKLLQDIMRVRKAYPIHSDAIDGVVKAHTNLGIKYPVTEYNASWEILLNKLKYCCDTIMDVLILPRYFGHQEKIVYSILRRMSEYGRAKKQSPQIRQAVQA